MAEVTMSLAELDQLRQDLKTANDAVKAKDAIIKEKDEQIIAVQNDKRTVLVTHKETLPKTEDEYFHRHNRQHYNEMNHVLENLSYKLGSRYNTHGISQLLEEAGFVYRGRHYQRREITPSVTVTREFVNFEDVKVELKQQIEGAVSAEVDGYKKKITELEAIITNSAIKSDTALNALEEKWKTKYESMEVHKDKLFNILQEDYRLLKEDKKKQTLEARIAELEQELAEVKAKKKRSWF